MVITPGWIIKPNSNITRNYKKIREIGTTTSALKGSKSFKSQSNAISYFFFNFCIYFAGTST